MSAAVRIVVRRGLLAVAAAAVALAGLPEPAVAQDETLAGQNVEAIRFVGARAFRSATLRSAIRTETGGCRIASLLPPCWFGMLQRDEPLDLEVLRADALRLRLFYYQRGYRDAEIEAETEPHEDGVRVVFRIREGQPVRVADLEIADVDGALPPGIATELPLATGDPLDLIRYEAVRDSLRSLLRNQGYPRAEVLARYFIPSDAPLEAQVAYDVLAGAAARFGAVRVEGVDRVAPTVVRRMLTFGPGDVYRADELLQSQRNIYGLGVFRHVQLSPAIDDDSPDSIMPVVVQVTEGNVHRVRFGAGMNTTDALNAEGRWSSRNFLGGARRLELSGRIGNVLARPVSELLDQVPGLARVDTAFNRIDGSLSADFSQPWFFDPYNTLNLGLFVERRSLPGVFVREARGGHLSVTRTISSRTSATLAYRPELTSLRSEGDLFYCVNYLACTDGVISLLRDPHWLAPVAFSLTRDRSNSLLSPSRGHILQLDAEYATSGTGSEFAYTRVSADFRTYRRVSDGIVLAGRLRPAWARVIDASDDQSGLGLNPQKRFFAGGPNSVRGFAQYRLGPKVLTVDAAGVLAAPTDAGGAGCSFAEINGGTCDASPVASDRFEVRPVGGAAMLEGSLELRFPLSATDFRGAAFVDFGQVWSSADAVDGGSIVWTPGLGVRYFSPIGPVRVDIGYRPVRAEELTVITTKICSRAAGGSCEAPANGGSFEGAGFVNTRELVRLRQPIRWQARNGSLLDRVQIHLSIGQAF